MNFRRTWWRVFQRNDKINCSKSQTNYENGFPFEKTMFFLRMFLQTHGVNVSKTRTKFPAKKTNIVFAQIPRILKQSKCRKRNFPKNSSTFAVYSLDKPAVFFSAYSNKVNKCLKMIMRLWFFWRKFCSRKVLLDTLIGNVTFLSATNLPKNENFLNQGVKISNNYDFFRNKFLVRKIPLGKYNAALKTCWQFLDEKYQFNHSKFRNTLRFFLSVKNCSTKCPSGNVEGSFDGIV